MGWDPVSNKKITQIASYGGISLSKTWEVEARILKFEKNLGYPGLNKQKTLKKKKKKTLTRYKKLT